MTIRRRGLSAAVCACMLAPVGASGAAAQSSAEPKTLKIVVGFSAGGGYDTYARILSRHIGRHLPGQPAVIVQNMPGAAGLKAVQYLDSGAPQDGSVITAFNPGMITESLVNADKVRFKFTDVAWIGSITRDKSVLEKKIDELRTFEREYRTRLKTYLESQLRDLGERGSAAPSDSRAGAGGYAASGYGQRADTGS